MLFIKQGYKVTNFIFEEMGGGVRVLNALNFMKRFFNADWSGNIFKKKNIPKKPLIVIKKKSHCNKKEAFVTINTLKESSFYSNPKLLIES